MNTVKIRMLVPRRSDGGHRDRLWEFCRAHWERELPEVEIVEGDDEGDGPFNRSRAINLAAMGDWDVGIIIDADVLIKSKAIRHAIERVTDEGGVVFPFTERLSLDKLATLRLITGRIPSPKGGRVVERQSWNVSTCLVLDRDTWDRSQGFDERFEGWGGEDDAFHAVCQTISTVRRLPGPAWHLWHTRSAWRKDASLAWKARALSDRYVLAAGVDRRNPNKTSSGDDEAVYRLLSESRADDQIVVVCITNGQRPELLRRTLRSFEDNVTGTIGRRVLVGDGCYPQREGWETISVVAGTYSAAMREAQTHALASGQPWVFWLEDDWVFNRPVDLDELRRTMERHPEIVQLSLLRQAWYEHELRAGGIYAAAPNAFEQRDGWVAQRKYWSNNPMLTSRTVLARHAWPQVRASEQRFGQLLFSKDATSVAGVWGQLDDEPWVTHLGEERAGTGY